MFYVMSIILATIRGMTECYTKNLIQRYGRYKIVYILQMEGKLNCVYLKIYLYYDVTCRISHTHSATVEQV